MGSGVKTAVFGGQWGACPLPESPDLAVVAKLGLALFAATATAFATIAFAAIAFATAFAAAFAAIAVATAFATTAVTVA